MAEHDMTPAEYADDLRRTMAWTGTSVRTLAATAGISKAYIQQILHARSMPRVVVAGRIAEALMAPRLAESIVKHRTRECSACGAPFVTDHFSPSRRRFCSQRCRARQGNRDVRAVQRASLGAEVVRLREELALYRPAVAAFCLACEPEGLCRDGACPLRPVSPLPQADERLRVA